MARGGSPSDGPEQNASLISAERSDGGAPPVGRDGANGPQEDRRDSEDINSPRGRREGGGPEVTAPRDAELESRSSGEIFSPKPQLLYAGRDSRGLRERWFRKVRSVFCCLAPPEGEGLYQPTPEPGDGDEKVTEFTEIAGLAAQQPQRPGEGLTEFVIGPKGEGDGRKTLVLDLDETLVHSSFRPVEHPDWVIPVDIDGKMVDVYVLKRPWLEHFMRSVGDRFEVVVFTASLSKYADPLLDLLDECNVVRWRLFREACSPYEGNYVKDLNRLGRDLASTIIVDNSPLSYIFQPANALPIGAFMGEKDDQELLEMVPLLMDLEGVDDVREYLAQQSGGFQRSVLSNGMSLVPLGHGVGSELCQSS